MFYRDRFTYKDEYNNINTTTGRTYLDLEKNIFYAFDGKYFYVQKDHDMPFLLVQELTVPERIRKTLIL